ncbi:MAG TPA: hypothetical protein VFV52_13875 [Bacilli bacterium]|nr:hypothetical protein [Bacilli bacterium]
MRKRLAFYGTMALTLGIGIALGQVGFATGNTVPGSADDPIVTKSYVDQKIAELNKTTSSTNGGTTTGTTGNTGTTTPTGTSVAGIDTFKPIKLTAGQTLLGGEGTEIIVRGPGEVLAVAPGADGLSDITGALDIPNGQALAKNHMLLIPRKDGRGIKATAETYIMVRGTYTLQ